MTRSSRTRYEWFRFPPLTSTLNFESCTRGRAIREQRGRFVHAHAGTTVAIALRSGLPVAATGATGTACGPVAPPSHNPHDQASRAQASVTARCTISFCCTCAPNRSVLSPTQRNPPRTALPVVGCGRSRVPSRSEAPRLASPSGQVSIARSTRTNQTWLQRSRLAWRLLPTTSRQAPCTGSADRMIDVLWPRNCERGIGWVLVAYLFRPYDPKLSEMPSFGCDTPSAERLAQSTIHMQRAATTVRLAWQRALRRRQAVGRST